MLAYSRAARAEIARARSGHERAAQRQPAAAGARPAEGRLHLDRHARAAHAAHLDPRVLRDPARQPDTRPGAARSASSASSSRNPSASRGSSTRCSTSPSSSRATPSGKPRRSTCARSIEDAVASTEPALQGPERRARDASSPDALPPRRRRPRPPACRCCSTCCPTPSKFCADGTGASR